MELNVAWDFFFATSLLLIIGWYISEKQARLNVPKVRQFVFFLGWALAVTLLVGPIPHAAVNTFWVHMVQHIGLMMLISPMLVLGSPGQIASQSRYQRLSRFAHALGRNRFFCTLLRPQVGFGVFLAVLILTHFSPLANAGMTNPNVHCIELMLFLTGGLIYYYPILEGNPHPVFVPYFHRVLSLFAMMVPETMVGFFLYSGNRLLHSLPAYMQMNMNMGGSSGTSMGGMSMGLADQHKGGAIMWAGGMLIDSCWIVLAARDWLVHEKMAADAADAVDELNNEHEIH